HGHRSEVCPSAFDQDFRESHINANALQGYQNRPVNDPYSNTYNPGWRNHPNFSWSNNNNTQQRRQNFMQQPNRPNFAPQQHMRPNFPQQPQRVPMGGMQTQGAGPSSATQEEKLDKILQFMTNQESTIKRMETQIGQLASRVGNLEVESDKGKLPSQPEQEKAITVLRSGKVVDNQVKIPDFDDDKEPTVDLCTTDQPNAQPTLWLKELPRHLKYVFLDKEMQKPVIIFAELAKDEERKLLEVLRTNKQAIGWGLEDLKGISPYTCMHRIVLEEGAKPFRDSQRRLNPNVMEVVKKEVLKLYSEGLIFPVADSEWVSPIHVVPKKGGITVIENEKKEMIPTRIITGWRMCIDYRRLNVVTKKDHFPLPFIDQILDRLSSHQYYCFLDGLSGYYQVAIAPEDQSKTTFTCPFGTFAFR
ncbi:Unknown protein, partial [Striga hermonthica]